MLDTGIWQEKKGLRKNPDNKDRILAQYDVIRDRLDPSYAPEGTEHYVGLVRQDPDGTYYLDGFAWNDSSAWNDGFAWNDSLSRAGNHNSVAVTGSGEPLGVNTFVPGPAAMQ